MNEVDTSQETINAEFEAAEQVIGVTPENTPEQLAIDPMAEAEKEAQIAIAKEMMSTTLRLSIGLFTNVSIETKYTDEAAQAYAVLIIKYFPGGIFGLLDKYKEEIAAGTATFILIRAISQAKAKQMEEEEKAAQAKKQSNTSGMGPFKFGEDSKEPQGGSANG